MINKPNVFSPPNNLVRFCFLFISVTFLCLLFSLSHVHADSIPSGSTALTNGNTGGQYQLYNSVQSGGGPVCTLNVNCPGEGLYEMHTYVKIIAPTPNITNQLTTVTVVNACKVVSDGTGWEDHGYAPGAAIDDMVAVAEYTDGNSGSGDYGSTGIATGSVQHCNGSGNITLRLNGGSFTPDPHYGTGISSVIIDVAKCVYTGVSMQVSGCSTGHVGEKVFTISTSNNVYASYVDTAPNLSPGDPSNGYNGSTYNSGDPKDLYGNEADSVSLQNPAADYAYNGAQQPAGPENTYSFSFVPDCSFSGQEVWLKWRSGQGTATTQPNNDEYWQLTDNGVPVGFNDPITGTPTTTHHTNNDGQGLQQAGFTNFKRGDVYTWTWYGVDRAHGVTLWLPFSSVTSNTALFSANNCPTPNAKCSWMGVDTNNTATASVNGKSYTTTNTSVLISMQFYNNGQTTWPGGSYGIHYGASGGSTITLANDVYPYPQSPYIYNVWGSNHSDAQDGKLEFHYKGDAADTYYFQMVDGSGVGFGSRCSVTINWNVAGGQGAFTCSRFETPNNSGPASIPSVQNWGNPTSIPTSNAYFRVTVLNNQNATPSGGPALNSTRSSVPVYPNPNNIGDPNSGSSGSWATWPGSASPWSWRVNAPASDPSPGNLWQVDFPSPTGHDRKVYVEYWQKTVSGKWQYHYYIQQINNCYSASCTLTITPDAGSNIPGSPAEPNPVAAGGGFTATLNEYNTGWDQLPDAKFMPPNGPDIVSFITTGPNWPGISMDNLYQDGPTDIPWFGSKSASRHFGAPGTEGPYFLTVQPEYNGGTWLGSACSQQVDVYAYFSMTPTAQFTSFNPENPQTINYQTSVQVNTMPNPPGSIRSSYTSSLTGPATGLPKNDSGVDVYPSSNTPYNYTYTNPGGILSIHAGDQYCVSMTLNTANGWVWTSGGGAEDIANPQSAVAGPYCNNVVNEPYVHYYGNDVIAGAGFGPQAKTCTPDAGGSINTYNNAGAVGYGYSGSGSQLGAFALALVDGFVSADQRGTIPTAPKGLTFANTSGAYGGNFGASPQDYCADDYYGDFFNQQNIPPYSMLGSFIGGVGDAGGVGGSAGSHDYLRNGDLQVNGLTMQNGVNATVFVNGNVYISSDIAYAGANGGWFSVSDVPSLFIVTSPGHNIYVSNAVGQMDGVYVAEPNGSAGGLIDTCNDSTGSLSFNGSGNGAQYAYCSKQLIVNGSFVAQKIELHRTFSSLRYAQPGENLGTAVHDCGTKLQDGVTEATGAECAAEVFNFSPELYLSLPSIEPYGGPTRQTFDAYDSLPPIL